MARVRTGINADETAAVVDQHTGKVKAHFRGLGAKHDAESFLRRCQRTANPKDKVDFLSSATVITGETAAKAIKYGRT